jgi:hypothetical protein
MSDHRKSEPAGRPRGPEWDSMPQGGVLPCHVHEVSVAGRYGSTPEEAAAAIAAGKPAASLGVLIEFGFYVGAGADLGGGTSCVIHPILTDLDTAAKLWDALGTLLSALAARGGGEGAN